MKKIISVIIIALMLITAFAACGKKTGSATGAASGTSIGSTTGSSSSSSGSSTSGSASGSTDSSTSGSSSSSSSGSSSGSTDSPSGTAGASSGSSSSGSTGSTTGSSEPSGTGTPSSGTSSGKASGTDIPYAGGAVSPTDVTDKTAVKALKKESMVTAEPKDADFSTLVMNKASRDYDSSKGTVYSTAPSSCVKNKDYTAYDFEIKEAGTYTLVVKYVARTMNPGKRGLSYTFDDGEQNDVELTPTGSDNSTFGYLLAEFTASPGAHTVKIGATADFNDSSVKSCDYYYIKVYKNK